MNSEVTYLFLAYVDQVVIPVLDPRIVRSTDLHSQDHQTGMHSLLSQHEDVSYSVLQAPSIDSDSHIVNDSLVEDVAIVHPGL